MNMTNCKTLITKLEETQILSKEEFAFLIAQHSEEDAQFLFERARAVRERVFGKSVYLRDGAGARFRKVRLFARVD